jgi:hypothetical protein
MTVGEVTSYRDYDDCQTMRASDHPLLVDLGLQLDHYQSVTFQRRDPHVLVFVNNDAIIDILKRAIVGSCRYRFWHVKEEHSHVKWVVHSSTT